MQSRSRRAALALALVVVVGAPRAILAGSPPVQNQVKLELQITGLTRGDCEIVIKPGHAGCQFTKVVRKVRGSGPSDRTVLPLDPILAQSTNADRDCAFAITIKEPGQPERTIRRGIRLVPQTAEKPLPTQTMTCYITAPSVAARDRDTPATKRR